MKYEAILFDMDGTLVDTEPIHEQAFKEVFSEYGVTITESEFKALIVGKTDENGLKDYIAHSGKTLPVAEFVEKKLSAFSRLAEGNVKAYAGVIELVRELSYHAPLALVTNSSRREADIVLQSLDIDDCFDIIVTVDDVENGKPDPEGYLRAARLLTKDPKVCVVVEDTPTGVAAAKAANIDCIAITNTHSQDELQGADRFAAELTQSLF